MTRRRQGVMGAGRFQAMAGGRRRDVGAITSGFTGSSMEGEGYIALRHRFDR